MARKRSLPQTRHFAPNSALCPKLGTLPKTRHSASNSALYAKLGTLTQTRFSKYNNSMKSEKQPRSVFQNTTVELKKPNALFVYKTKMLFVGFLLLLLIQTSFSIEMLFFLDFSFCFGLFFVSQIAKRPMSQRHFRPMLPERVKFSVIQSF